MSASVTFAWECAGPNAQLVVPIINALYGIEEDDTSVTADNLMSVLTESDIASTAIVAHVHDFWSKLCRLTDEGERWRRYGLTISEGIIGVAEVMRPRVALEAAQSQHGRSHATPRPHTDRWAIIYMERVHCQALLLVFEAIRILYKVDTARAPAKYGSGPVQDMCACLGMLTHITRMLEASWYSRYVVSDRRRFSLVCTDLQKTLHMHAQEASIYGIVAARAVRCLEEWTSRYAHHAHAHAQVCGPSCRTISGVFCAHCERLATGICGRLATCCGPGTRSCEGSQCAARRED